MIKKIFYHLIKNTKLTNEIPQTEEQALNYLNYIMDPVFGFRNDNNYDAYDYEKIIYIEINFKNNNEIQDKILELKKFIANNYVYKKQYLKRIKSNTFTNIKIIDPVAARQYKYNLPESNKKIK